MKQFYRRSIRKGKDERRSSARGFESRLRRSREKIGEKLNKRLRNNKWLLVLLISVMLWAAIALGLCAGLSLVFRVQAQVPEVRVIIPERQKTQIHAESLVWVAEPESFMPTEEELEEELYYDSLELLAICVEAEAGNQPLDGKRMVVDVILNRVDDPAWPDTIEGVITEPYAFSSYWDGGMARVWEPSEETYLAVRMELEERSWPELYYFTAGGYGSYGTPWKQVGDHYFSTK